MADAGYEYAMAALQILALSPGQLDGYLPPPFLETRLHGRDGDVWCSGSLSAIVMICGECLGLFSLSGRGAMDGESGESEGILAALSQQVDELDLPDEQDLEIRAALRAGDATDIVHAMQRCRTSAVQLLTRLGRFEPNALPAFSAERLLNEWSYGAYAGACR